MRRAGRFEKGAKLPLDFTHRIRYNKNRSKNDTPVCRNGRRGGLKIPCANNTCGFDPHHRHKKEALQLVWGAFFLSAACERVEQHGPDKECSGNVNHPHLPDRMVYRSGNGAVHFLCGSFCFLSAAPLRVPVVPFCLIPLPQRSVFARCICGCSAARLFREWLSVLPKRRTPARKKRRNAVPTIYSAVSYRFYNVFYKKVFTNEF